RDEYQLAIFEIVAKLHSWGTPEELALGALRPDDVPDADFLTVFAGVETALWSSLVHDDPSDAWGLTIGVSLAGLLIGTGRGTLGRVLVEWSLAHATRCSDTRAHDMALRLAYLEAPPDGAYDRFRTDNPAAIQAASKTLDEERATYGLVRHIDDPDTAAWYHAQRLLDACTTWFWLTGDYLPDGLVAASETLGLIADTGTIVQSQAHGELFQSLAAAATDTPPEPVRLSRSDTIDAFWREHRFLSNFWPAEVELEGVTYPSVEHAYQASKSSDNALRRRIRACATPGAAKKEGATIVPSDRWLDTRIDLMRGLLRQKFANEPLRGMLLATGDAFLIEGNTWHDTFWGVDHGEGENHLGMLLMEIRDELSGG
ncbi:MAG: NADAR family protein, partial [Acidimicrobiales bacterium]|nr:NADAR family protein [Acidimicrobiales bacterium]